jgi:hypothetical protein
VKTPEINSSTRIWIGCVAENTTVGTASSRTSCISLAHLLQHAHGLFERRRWNAGHPHHDLAFLQRRHELLPQQRQRGKRHGKERDGDGRHDLVPAKRPMIVTPPGSA